MNQHDREIGSVCSDATKALYRRITEVEEEATEKLRTLFKGKRVRCHCFDSLIDGDSLFFEGELLDIRVRRKYDENIDFYVTVTLMCKSLFSGPEEQPIPRTYYLSSIESVEGE